MSEVITENNVSKILAKTFLWMFLGILATTIISWYTYSIGMAETFATNGTYMVLLIVEVVVVLLFTFLFRKLPAIVVGILYFIYAVINGITLSTIFVLFELNSIVMIFFAAALFFGIFALFGFFTKMDISKIAPLLFGALILGVILSIVNVFLGNSMLDILLSWGILLLFFGITAYDMQKIKKLAMAENAEENKVYIYGAMELYLDFINIFLRILSLFGRRK